MNWGISQHASFYNVVKEGICIFSLYINFLHNTKNSWVAFLPLLRRPIQVLPMGRHSRANSRCKCVRNALVIVTKSVYTRDRQTDTHTGRKVRWGGFCTIFYHLFYSSHPQLTFPEWGELTSLNINEFFVHGEKFLIYLSRYFTLLCKWWQYSKLSDVLRSFTNVLFVYFSKIYKYTVY